MKYLPIALLTLALPACDPVESTSGSTTDTTSSTSTTSLVQNPVVSECGGFPRTKVDPPTPDGATYCDAEALLWVYDANMWSLGLTDARMMLNCCGQHSITVELDATGTYVIHEQDAPELVDGTPSRCDCMCVFDFGVSVEPVPPGTIDVRVVLDVTDSGASPEVVYEGTIDLGAGSGSIVIDTTSADPWCNSAP